MTQGTAGAGADDSTAISPDTTIQGGTGSLTITVPGCVYIGSPQPSPDQPMSPAQGATPTGAILPYAGEMAPEGYLLCNGAEINRTTYASLFGVIGSTYGVGNGNTTFHLPDLRGRFPLGLDNMGGTSADRVTSSQADSLGGSGGVDTVTLTKLQLPDHEHKVLSKLNDFAGTNPYEGVQQTTGNTNYFQRSGGGEDYGRYVGYTAGSGGNGTAWYEHEDDTDVNRRDRHIPLVTGGVAGNGQSHDNMSPYLALNYIIKT